MQYSFIVLDTETTGLKDIHDVIEISMIRLSDGVQKTWFLKPLSVETADAGALRVNGHKIEDLKGETKYGRETYKDPHKVLVEIENWLMEDGVPTENRVIVGQNCPFDKRKLEVLWEKCGCSDSFPFGRRFLDTMVLAFAMDIAKDSLSESYSLSALIKKYGIKNEKAHSAEADTRATSELFNAQIKELKSAFAK